MNDAQKVGFEVQTVNANGVSAERLPKDNGRNSSLPGRQFRSFFNNFKGAEGGEFLDRDHRKFQFALNVWLHSVKGLDDRPVGSAGATEHVKIPLQGGAI